MELRFQAAKEAAILQTLKPGDQLKSADEFYRALKDSSSPRQILDDLLDIRSCSLPTPSRGWAKTWAAPSRSTRWADHHALLQTGHNITRCAVQVSPLALSKVSEVMEFGTETQKAVMRGRMATAIWLSLLLLV